MDGLPVGSPRGLLSIRRSRGRAYLTATPNRKPASNSRTTFYPPSLLVQRSRWCRNVDLLPIDYAFQPRLRDRLTLGGMALPRNPWAYGEKDSHLLYRYSSRHNHLDHVQRSLPSSFARSSNAPLPMHTSTCAVWSFGSMLSPVHFRRRVARLVSYYALFKWWLLLSQHPSCLCNTTSLSTLSTDSGP